MIICPMTGYLMICSHLLNTIFTFFTYKSIVFLLFSFHNANFVQIGKVLCVNTGIENEDYPDGVPEITGAAKVRHFNIKTVVLRYNIVN